jgi:outer membrane protein
MDFVFDKSGMSVSGVPLLIYATESADFTNDVIATLNKGAKPTTEKPATSPAAAAPAASPKSTTKP